MPFHFLQYRRQLACGERFKYVFIDLQADRLLSVFKLLKAGKYNDLCRRIMSPRPLRQLQAVHKRHLNISYNDIRDMLLNQLCRFLPVLSRIHDYKP
ncbi:hypothetical protein D3C77_727470 [compost metagenome]